MTRTFLAIAFSFASLGADFPNLNPNVFGPDDPRTKMMGADVRRRMQEANLRESQAFAAVTTKEQWEKHRDERIRKLRESLGTFPDVPKNMRIATTRKFEGEGFAIHNIVYESRTGLWVSANLYLPAKPPEKMPGIILAHAHHTPKTDGELQDMGMTWARSGTAVLVPDQLGYGERRNHDFHTAKDFDKPYRVGRQDYFFRFNSNLQLSGVGDSLMGWMAWDLLRGVDVLLQQPGIDKDRIILMGAVAGGGDPAGVTAALDPRIACVVPFNFGGWQPESSVVGNPDRDFAWFGDGYWESTRGLRGGAAGGFAHFDIVGSVAPRKVIYAHEFGWDATTDPAWPRLQKIFGFYDAKDSLRVAHGAGSVRNSGAGNTHCNHIGATHRKMIYPALKDWFGMPIPEEYSKRLPTSELLCWTDAARTELKPKKLHEVLTLIAEERIASANLLAKKIGPDEYRKHVQKEWTKSLGNIEPVAKPKLTEVGTEEIKRLEPDAQARVELQPSLRVGLVQDGVKVVRFSLEVEPGIVLPGLFLTPKEAKGKLPIVVMVAQAGKAGFLKERSEAIEAFLKAGVAVALVDVRGTGETKPGSSADRGSNRTSISQTNLMLGQPLLGSQLRDLRTVIRWLQAKDGIDPKRIAVWGDSFAKVNASDAKVAVPHDHEQPAIGEPGGANLALLAGLFEGDLVAIYANGGLAAGALFTGPYLHLPHDAVPPAPLPITDSVLPAVRSVLFNGAVDAQNRAAGKAKPTVVATKWTIEKLNAK